VGSHFCIGVPLRLEVISSPRSARSPLDASQINSYVQWNRCEDALVTASVMGKPAPVYAILPYRKWGSLSLTASLPIREFNEPIGSCPWQFGYLCARPNSAFAFGSPSCS